MNENNALHIKEAAYKLLEFENKVDVLEPKYFNIHLWPLIRQSLMPYIIHGTYPNIDVSQRDLLISRGTTTVDVAFPLKEKGDSTPYPVLLVKTAPRDILIGGHSYDPFADPFMEIGEAYKYYFKLNATNQVENNPFYPSLSPFWIFRSKEIQISQKNIIISIKFLNSIYKFFGVMLDLSNIINSLYKILSLGKCFREYIKHHSIKEIYYTCYYSNIAMAINVACHGTYCHSIDYQHGQQGKYHFMYTHWSKFPLGGYALLPKIFETWGLRYTKNLSRWYPLNSGHTVRTGHNIWLEKNKNRSGIKIWEEHPKLLYKTGKCPIVLLVLQPLEPIFPRIYFKVIQRTHHSLFWIVRSHPNTPDSMIQTLMLSLSLLPPESFIFQLPKQMMIYDAIQLSNVIITRYSTVALEGVEMGKIAIVIDPYAKDIFSDHLEAKNILYAENEDILTKMLFSCINRS